MVLHVWPFFDLMETQSFFSGSKKMLSFEVNVMRPILKKNNGFLCLPSHNNSSVFPDVWASNVISQVKFLHQRLKNSLTNCRCKKQGFQIFSKQKRFHDSLIFMSLGHWCIFKTWRLRQHPVVAPTPHFDQSKIEYSGVHGHTQVTRTLLNNLAF